MYSPEKALRGRLTRAESRRSKYFVVSSHCPESRARFACRTTVAFDRIEGP